MNGHMYGVLAEHYDALMSHVDYAAWVDYALRFLPGAETLLDLGCGTGAAAKLLTDRGYEVVAVDGSVEMLMAARAKTDKPLFLNQKFTGLDLYGTVQGAICMLDGLNYLLKTEELAETLRRVCLFLEPGCRFVFDVHTHKKLAGLDQKNLVSSSPDAFCVWRHEWSPPICDYYITLFERRGELWARYIEHHRERAYFAEEIEASAKNAGFGKIDVYEHLTMRPPGNETERMFFVLEK